MSELGLKNGSDRTGWHPDIQSRKGPRYRAIADALQQDMAAGRLQAGQRLPTHRDLAWRLGVTVGTVTRAYVEAERRGLVGGEVGRGTFVRQQMPEFLEPGEAEMRLHRHDNAIPPGPIELAGNAPPTPPLADRIAQAMASVAEDPDFGEFLRYRPSQGLEDHARAGADWIANFGLSVDPAQVIPTNGAQHGMLVAISAAAGAGETLLTENLVFFGLKALGRVLGLRLQGVEMDGEGILPDALEAAIKSTGSRALYLSPTIQNPTCGILSPERRQAIAEICRRHGVTVIEDDIYNFLMDEPVAPVASYLPEQTIYLANLSKPLAPALRVGYVAAPPHLHGGILTGIRATGVMVSPLMQEVGARLIHDGTALENGRLVRERAKERQKIVGRHLSDWPLQRQAASLHVWLPLPEAWRREAFTAACLQRGVAVASGDVFAIGRQSAPHCVRLSITGPRSDAELEAGLDVVRSLLKSDGIVAYQHL
ncbi:MAG: PLP-dependent aminotransferase family protein [Rhodospirillales bacterium]